MRPIPVSTRLMAARYCHGTPNAASASWYQATRSAAGAGAWMRQAGISVDGEPVSARRSRRAAAWVAAMGCSSGGSPARTAASHSGWSPSWR